jgi:L-lysine exporter family protein LysE/ArgO
VLNSGLAGLLTGLSLIVAIGAQNAFVLRQGLRRAYVGPIVAVCTLSDVVLIVAGVAGIGAVIQHAGWALQAVRWFGVAFLTWYGLSSAWRARHPSALPGAPDAAAASIAGAAAASIAGAAAASIAGAAAASTADATAASTAARPRPVGRAPALRRIFALTWLNPHVYLDTVILLGSIANTHGPSGRWWFAVGAAAGSTLWFSGLGFGARLAAPLLTTPRAWQVLDLLIAATMLAIAAKLAF